MSYVTKREINWLRLFSAFGDTIKIPAGSPVEKEGEELWVSPSIFPEKSIERHDAVHYGIHVNPDDVEEKK